MHEDRNDEEQIGATQAVKLISKVEEYWRDLAGKELHMQRGAGIAKTGDPLAIATFAQGSFHDKRP